MGYLNPDFQPFFMWANQPRVLFGPGSREELGFEMAQLGVHRPLLVTDAGVAAAGVAGLVAEAAVQGDLEIAGIFDAVVQDARIDIINQGAGVFRESRADAVVAVGGGSVMDTAQAIAILIGEGKADFAPLAAQAALFDNPAPLPPQIVLPTTAGSGSEVSLGMVVLDTQAGQKLAVAHPKNADIAILDPELTLGLPPGLTASCGMDALTHAIESIVSTGAQPITDGLALHAVAMILSQLPVCIREPENIDARGQMLIASTMAGICFNNTMTGAVHALAHALGGEYGIPHGTANAILLPHVMAFNLEAVPARYAMIARAMGTDIRNMDPVQAGFRAIESVRALKEEISLTLTLADYHVPENPDLLAALVEKAAMDSQLSYNPRPLDEEDILDLYLSARRLS